MEPKELQVGFDPETGKADSVQYIPIFETLKILLNKEDIFAYHIEQQNSVTENFNLSSDTLKSFQNGKAFYANRLLNSNKKTVKLILYHDDFNVVNPLGNKTVKCKTAAFYFVLGKLPSKFRSKLSDINLVLLASAQIVSKYGYHKILQPVLDDIKELETKGVEVRFEGLSHIFYGTVSMVIADNLAAHALAGFYCIFSTVNRFCRFCNITRAELQEGKKITSFSLRTNTSYDNNVKDIEQLPHLASVYGIKANSCLNSLSYFHAVDGFPPDLAHDLFEGIAIDILTNIMSRLIETSQLTLVTINSAIKNFEYCEIDKQNKPQEVKVISPAKFKIKQTACEMWNLVRLAPLILGEYVEIENDCWNLLILFCQLTERLCALEFSKSDLVFLDEVLHTFFSKYMSKFPDTIIKPKAHFIQHYPQMISRFGPLIKTLRFESKHSFFQSALALNKNRKNIFQPTAKKHQFWMYLHYSSMDNEIISQGIGITEVPVESFNDIQQRYLTDVLKIKENDLLSKARAVRVNGQRYNSGNVVVLGIANDNYILGKINCVIFHEAEVFLFCTVFSIESFSFHFNSYDCVETDGLKLIKVAELYDYHPLGCYKVKGRFYVPLRHYIHIPFTP